jgi:hypothetical protein
VTDGPWSPPMQSIEIFIVIAGKMQSRRKCRSLRYQDTSVPG